LRNYFEEKDNYTDVYNPGVSVYITADLFEQIEVEAKSREPNLIIFAIGNKDLIDGLHLNGKGQIKIF